MTADCAVVELKLRKVAHLWPVELTSAASETVSMAAVNDGSALSAKRLCWQQLGAGAALLDSTRSWQHPSSRWFRWKPSSVT